MYISIQLFFKKYPMNILLRTIEIPLSTLNYSTIEEKKKKQL